MSLSLPKSLKLKEDFSIKEPSSNLSSQNNNISISEEKSLKPKSLKLKETIRDDSPEFDLDEDIQRDIERNQAQVTSRMLERTFGLPGDLYNLLPNYIHKINPLHPLHKKLPTSAQLRKISEKATGGYTKPQTSFEEKVGEYSGDVASYALASPGKTFMGGLTKVLGIPLSGQLAKEGVKGLGGGEKAQEAGKLGTMLLLDLWGIKKGIGEGGAKKFGYNRLEEAEKAIPKDAMADVKVFEKKLDSLERNLREGVTGAHSSEALRAINEIKGNIAKGEMKASLFPKIRKDLNKLIDNLQGFSLEGPPRKIKRAAIKNLNDVKKAVIQAGNRWGRGKSPEFFKNWKEGNEALSVYHKSNDLSRFIAKNTQIQNPILRYMVGMHGYHHPVKTLGLAAAKKGAEIATHFPTAMVYRVLNSKVLRDLYKKMLLEASKGNSTALAASASKLQEKMDEQNIR